MTMNRKSFLSRMFLSACALFGFKPKKNDADKTSCAIVITIENRPEEDGWFSVMRMAVTNHPSETICCEFESEDQFRVPVLSDGRRDAPYNLAVMAVFFDHCRKVMDYRSRCDEFQIEDYVVPGAWAAHCAAMDEMAGPPPLPGEPVVWKPVS